MTANLGEQAHDGLSSHRAPRQVNARAHPGHRAEAIGAHLLVVDPRPDEANLVADLSSRGVHVTWVSSALDGLLEYGRVDPSAVLVSSAVEGVSASEFIAKIHEYGSTFVAAGVAADDVNDAGRLILAGASAVVARPYRAPEVWGVLQRYRHALDHHARFSLGPIELDARAYTVRVDGARIPDLPLKEFELLRVLLHRAPEVLSDEELRSSLWGSEEGGPTDNTIAVHATRLRSRLQGVARIRRIRGRGYSLTLETDALPGRFG